MIGTMPSVMIAMPTSTSASASPISPFRLRRAEAFRGQGGVTVAPEGATLAESNRNLDAVVKVLKEEQKRTGIKLLWGTANLFSNARYVHGAADDIMQRRIHRDAKDPVHGGEQLAQ